MALSNLSKETSNRLFEYLESDIISNNNILIDSKKNASAYAKLELIKSQMCFLQKQATDIIEDIKIDIELQKIKCNFKKVPGNYYYCYKNDDKVFLSLISPGEWKTDHIFLGKYLFDFDYIFKKS